MAGHGVRGTAGAVIALLAAALIVGCSAPGSGTAAAHSPRATDTESSSPVTVIEEHPYVGMWVTADHHIRQELLPNGRYDEARGTRASAYTGRYWVNGTHIEYKDDTGFTATARSTATYCTTAATSSTAKAAPPIARRRATDRTPAVHGPRRGGPQTTSNSLPSGSRIAAA